MRFGGGLSLKKLHGKEFRFKLEGKVSKKMHFCRDFVARIKDLVE